MGLKADTLQVDLFDPLEEGGGYVVGMFSYCSSVRCNQRVSTGAFDLCCSWVFTPDCQNSCWYTKVFNRMYNNQSRHSDCFTKKGFTKICYIFTVSQSLWMALTLTVPVMDVFTTARELAHWLETLLINLLLELSDSVTHGCLSFAFRMRVKDIRETGEADK